MKQGNKKLLFLCVCIILIGFVSCHFLINSSNNTEKGISYIKKQESLKTAPVEKAIKKRKKQEKLQAIQNGEISVFSMLDDSVILGDSRVTGFDEYGLLPDNHVLGVVGVSCKDISNHIDEVKDLNPTDIYFSYGMNDIKNNLINVDGGYAKFYAAQINEIVKVDPSAHIYVCSIIPATKEAVKDDEVWKQIDAYNKEIKSMCKQNNWIYIDCSSVTENGNEEWYEKDGIHFIKSAYERWAQCLVNAMQEE